MKNYEDNIQRCSENYMMYKNIKMQNEQPQTPHSNKFPSNKNKRKLKYRHNLIMVLNQD
jgi:hypothetical protein